MKSMINLLPAAYRRQQIIRKRVLQWASVLCVVVAAGSGWHWLEQREELQLAEQLQSLEREHAPVETMLGQLIAMRRQLDELQQQENVAAELEYQRNALALLGLISESAQASNGRVRVTSLQVNDFQNMRRSQSASDRQEESADGVIVRGVSLDNPAVADMLASLQDSGMFSRVEVLIKERAEGEVSLREYELRCEF